MPSEERSCASCRKEPEDSGKCEHPKECVENGFKNWQPRRDYHDA